MRNRSPGVMPWVPMVAIRLPCVLAAGASVLALAALGQDVRSPDVDFARDVLPLLRDSCVDCHGGKEPEAGLSFERFADEGEATGSVGTWRRMRDRLERGEMPPPEAPPADEKQVQHALQWLAARLGTGPGSWPIDPGRVTIRRLNRVEYGNTIRDLLEIDFDVSGRLPPDDVGYGFDNMGDVLALPPLLLEKYAAAAEEIAGRALPGAELRASVVRRFEAEQMRTTLDRAVQQEVASLYSNGDVHAEVELPRAGEYRIRVRASGDQAGPEPCRMGLRAGRRELARIDVPVERPEFATYEWRGSLEGGRQRLAAAFLNDFYNPDDPDPGQRDRNLILDWIELEGPLDPLPPTRSERRLYVCGADHAHARDCAPAILKRLASRAWRRPAGDLEVARLMPFVDSALAEGEPFVPALRLAVAAILVSPRFLFRTEIDPAPDDPTRAHDLSDFELASRLSYFLWSSLPDDRLSGLAAQGLLREPRVLADEARRMVRDPRASALVTHFAAQWLQLRTLEKSSPDPQLFPEFDEALREAMRLETEMFVEAVLREGRPIRELLDADFTFVNERLAKHYGIDGVQGERMRRVRLRDPVRGGVLTHASLLTLTSNPTRTSPVKRGKFLLESILGAPPPPPPPGVGVLDESPQAAQAASLKERLEQHRGRPECASCHARMDALGFALERYGPTGAVRSSDGPHPVDDRARLPDGRTLAGATGLKEVLLEDDSFTRCVAEKLLAYAIGRGPTEDDRRVVAELARGFRGRSPTFEELIGGLLETAAFRRRRGEGAPGSGAPEGN